MLHHSFALHQISQIVTILGDFGFLAVPNPASIASLVIVPVAHEIRIAAQLGAAAFALYEKAGALAKTGSSKILLEEKRKIS